MLLNRVEYALMNNPMRAACQRHIEGRFLRRLGGPLPGGIVLEVGCGRGVGAEIILDLFGAESVHGFDLDHRMTALARRRLKRRGSRARVWVGDAAMIAATDGSYDAVFDFGVFHHLPDWRRGVAEVFRVLRPGGRLYAEEVLAPLVRRTRHLLEHPQADRFDAGAFADTLAAVGFQTITVRSIGRSFAWFVATRPGPFEERAIMAHGRADARPG